MSFKNVILTLLLLVCFIAKGDEVKSHLILWNNDGTKVGYALKDRPEITFNGDGMIVTTTNIQIYYPLGDCRYWSNTPNGGSETYPREFVMSK